MRKMYSLRLPVELMDRVRGEAGARGVTEFVVGALEGRLGVSEKNLDGGRLRRVSTDQAALLELVRERAVSSREAREHFGWLGLRYEKAENGLSRAGLIKFVGGILKEVGNG